MKKKFNYKLFFTFIITLCFACITNVYATNATVSVSANKSQVVVGNSVTFTVKVSSSVSIGAWNYEINYDKSKLTYTGGNALAHAGVPDNGSFKSVTFTFTFKSIASGKPNFSFILNELIDWDNGNEFTYQNKTSKSVTAITQAQLEASYSKNNNLSSLGVKGFTLSPTFNKSTTSYNVVVPNETKSIELTATKEDSKSSISGTGIKNVTEGNNTFQIVVTAQNGISKTYNVLVVVQELEPIEVLLNENKYNVIRKKELLVKPNDYFEESTITIDNKEVPCFKNKITGYILVGLQKDKEDIHLYMYDSINNSYTIYKEYTFNKIILNIKDNYEDLSNKYIKTNITLNNETYTAYKTKENSKYYLFHAMDISTGKINLYRYLDEDNTVQIHYEEKEEKIKNNHSSLLNKLFGIDISNQDSSIIYLYIIIGLGMFLLITYIVILITIIKKPKKRKKENVNNNS